MMQNLNDKSFLSAAVKKCFDGDPPVGAGRFCAKDIHGFDKSGKYYSMLFERKLIGRDHDVFVVCHQVNQESDRLLSVLTVLQLV